MLKALIFFLASLGIIDGGNDQNNDTKVKDRQEVRMDKLQGGPQGNPEPEEDDSKHSTKEGL